MIGILLIILSIVNVISIIITLAIIFTPYYNYSIVLVLISMLLYLIIFIIFSKNTNKQLEKEKENLKKLKLNRCVFKEDETNVIVFYLKNNHWTYYKDENIVFDLNGYLFKKSFIIARIVRELRYPIVSNQLYLAELLNFKLRIKKYDNVVVRFIDGKKIKEIHIVKSYISKNTFLSRAISESKYYDNYLFSRSYFKYMKVIEKINENIYLN